MSQVQVTWVCKKHGGPKGWDKYLISYFQKKQTFSVESESLDWSWKQLFTLDSAKNN